MCDYTVDRIENGFAVCEDENGGIVNISISQLPKNLREGDCIKRLNNGDFIIDAGLTEKRRKESAELFKSLLK